MLYDSLENQSDKKHENNNVVCVYVGERHTKKERETVRREGVHNYFPAISLIPAKG